jgi:hydrogenase maturation factor
MRDATRGGVGSVLCDSGDVRQGDIHYNPDCRTLSVSPCALCSVSIAVYRKRGEGVVVVRPRIGEKGIRGLKCMIRSRCSVIGRVGKLHPEAGVMISLLAQTVRHGSQGDQIPRIC